MTMTDFSELFNGAASTAASVGEAPGIATFDASLITHSGAGTYVANKTNPDTGEISVSDGTIERHGTWGTYRFRLDFDNDSSYTLDFAAILPAGGSIISAYPWGDASTQEPFSDINFNLSGTTAIDINRADSVDADVNYLVTMVVDGFDEVRSLAPGSVTPTPLEWLSISYNAGQSGYVGDEATTVGSGYRVADLGDPKLNAAGQTGWVNGNTITVPRSTTYQMVISYNDTISLSDWGLYINGAPVTSLYTGNSSTSGVDFTQPIMIELTAGDVLEFGSTQATSSNSPSDIGSFYWMIAQWPTGEVVPAGSVTPVDIGHQRFTASADNVGILPDSLAAISFEAHTTTPNVGGIATFDGTNIAVTAGVNPVELKALIHTTGSGNHSGGLHFRDIADAAGIKYGDGVVTDGVSSRGIYGFGSNNTPATATVPAGATVTLQVVHGVSASSQLVQTGSYIDVREIVGQQTVIPAADLQITNHPGVAGQTLTSNGDGTASWV